MSRAQVEISPHRLAAQIKARGLVIGADQNALFDATLHSPSQRCRTFERHLETFRRTGTI